MREIVIRKNEAGQRLDKFLHKYLKEAGNGFLYKMLRKKNITLNHKKADGSEKLIEGDVVALFMSDETIDKFRSAGDFHISSYQSAYQSLKGITVAGEDEDILILSKPQGIPSQKSGKDDISVNEWVIGYLLAKGALNEEDLKTFKPSVCNRLDTNTGGLILAGKSLGGLQVLSRALKDRNMNKYYLAVCEGRTEEEFALSGTLVKDEKNNKVRINASGGDGDPVRTEFRTLSYEDGYSLVEAHLITGRSHQIRAHLSSSGHPIAGDLKYGGKPVVREDLCMNHQLLYAYRVVFPDDESFGIYQNKEMCIPTPDPIRKMFKEYYADI